MRLLLGMVLGFLLTIGGAYLHDSRPGMRAEAASATERPMVNWDVVDRNWQRVSTRARQEWDKLASR